MAADLNLDRATLEGAQGLWRHASQGDEDDFFTWGEGPQEARDDYEAAARSVIEAALPHILEAVAGPFDVDDPYATIFMSEVAAFIRSFGEKQHGGTTRGASNDPSSVETGGRNGGMPRIPGTSRPDGPEDHTRTPFHVLLAGAPVRCGQCHDRPPKGFTCNRCGKSA